MFKCEKENENDIKCFCKSCTLCRKTSFTLPITSSHSSSDETASTPVHDTIQISENSLLHSRLFLPQAKVQTQHQAKDDNDENDNEEAPPLELSSVPSVSLGDCKMFITSCSVFFDSLGLSGGLLNRCFLQDDDLGEILEELVEFNQGLLNILNIIVTSSYRAKDTIGSSSTIRFELSTES